MIEPNPSQDAVSAEPVRCHPECPGWLHVEDPREVQACGECSRFTVWDPAAITEHDGSSPRGAFVSRDDLAQQAHAQECGCSWGQDPEAPAAPADLVSVWNLSDDFSRKLISPVAEYVRQGLKFTPTHEITLYAADMQTVTSTALVQLVENDAPSWLNDEDVEEGKVLAGPAYTEAEWEASASADWTRETDGSWLFQGEPVNCSIRKL